MKWFTTPEMLRRECMLAVFKAAKIIKQDEDFLLDYGLLNDTLIWQWTNRRPLARLVAFSRDILYLCRTITPEIAHIRAQHELRRLSQDSDNALMALLEDTRPLYNVFLGEKFSPEVFEQQLTLIIQAFTPKEGAAS